MQERRPPLRRIQSTVEKPKYVTAPAQLSGLERLEWFHAHKTKHKAAATQRLLVGAPGVPCALPNLVNHALRALAWWLRRRNTGSSPNVRGGRSAMPPAPACTGAFRCRCKTGWASCSASTALTHTPRAHSVRQAFSSLVHVTTFPPSPSRLAPLPAPSVGLFALLICCIMCATSVLRSAPQAVCGCDFVCHV